MKMKNLGFVLFAIAHCLATYALGACFLYVGLINLNVQPRPAELVHLEGLVRVMAFPAIYFLFDVLQQGPSWLLWLVVPLNSALAALLLRLLWEGAARLRRGARPHDLAEDPSST